MATDADIGSNANITYSISGAPGVFDVSPTSGRVSLIGTLNREMNSNYTLNVTAVDGGSPSRSSSILINVVVTDSNDNQPQFDAPSYNGSIIEVRTAL